MRQGISKSVGMFTACAVWALFLGLLAVALGWVVQLAVSVWREALGALFGT